MHNYWSIGLTRLGSTDAGPTANGQLLPAGRNTNWAPELHCRSADSLPAANEATLVFIPIHSTRTTQLKKKQTKQTAKTGRITVTCHSVDGGLWTSGNWLAEQTMNVAPTRKKRRRRLRRGGQTDQEKPNSSANHLNFNAVNGDYKREEAPVCFFSFPLNCTGSQSFVNWVKKSTRSSVGTCRRIEQLCEIVNNSAAAALPNWR